MFINGQTPISPEDCDLILEKTNSNFFKEKNIFITGGTGFIGKWLLTTFAAANMKTDQNCKVTVLTRNQKNFLEINPQFANLPFLTFHTGNVTSFDFPEGNFDYIIHAATDASQKMIIENPLAMFETIVNGTKRVLEFSRQNKLQNFLLVSSGGVYGVQPPTVSHMPEDFTGCHHPSHWQAPYSEGKRAAESLCFMYAGEYGINFNIARCFAFVGPYLPLHEGYAVGNFIGNILRDEEIQIAGDGTPLRSYLYAADLVVWLLRILTEAKPQTIYNVGSDEAVSISALAERVAKAALPPGTKSCIKTAQKPQGDTLPARYIPSIAAAKKDLSLKVFTPLDEAIAKTIAFNRQMSSPQRVNDSGF